MKKLLLSLMLLLSVGVFADGPYGYQEDMLENNFNINKKVLTDGDVKLENIEYDLNIYNDGVMVKLEIESSFIKGDSWEKFNKESFDKLMEEIVSEIRNKLDKKDIPVTISVEIEKMFSKDEVVYHKTFRK